MSKNTDTIDRIIRKPELKQAVSLSTSTIQRLVQAGKFPKPIKLGANSVGWKMSEVQEWIDSRERTGEVA